jgi:hypothetical protein
MKRTYSNYNAGLYVTVLFVSIFSLGCKKYVEVGAPNTSFNGENVYNTDATAIAATTAMYTKSGASSGVLGNSPLSVTYYAGISADELTVVTGGTGFLFDLYRNELSVTTAPDSWTLFYPLIYYANAAVEGLNASTSLTSSVKQQLLGEVKFMRAFYYFYLVNLYGEVPLILTTDYKKTELMSRTPASDVWRQIKTDLLEAKDLLNPNYVGADVITGSATTDRIRPNKWTAAALLARVYLYMGDYASAETQSTEIINSTSLYTLSSVNNVFIKNPTINKEGIWEIQPITTGWNTNDARVFVLPATGPNSGTYPVYLNKRLVYSFEPNDARYINWIKGIKVGVDSFYYAYKYKSAKLNDPITEYTVVFRLAEQYLIRAEARAIQNKFQQAIDDVNTIRLQHGGLTAPLATPTTQSQALNAILHERRVELFCEWGHRWLDLKRTNTVDDMMSLETPLKGGTWQPTDKYYPISSSELIADPNLTQTTGY